VKLGKLIRLLSSNRDGEVLAAVHALKRVLDGGKLDIHALADMVEAAGVSPARHGKTREPSWNQIARECASRPDLLRDHERAFVSDMVRWTAARGEPTPKQATWLRSIYVRVGWNE
jgi:hypothetical protein